MTCPWLVEEDGDSFCTAVDPRVLLDFDNPVEGVNGEICSFPAPGIAPSELWDVCKWYRER